jgi:hypothetical protein
MDVGMGLLCGSYGICEVAIPSYDDPRHFNQASRIDGKDPRLTLYAGFTVDQRVINAQGWSLLITEGKEGMILGRQVLVKMKVKYRGPQLLKYVTSPMFLFCASTLNETSSPQ